MSHYATAYICTKGHVSSSGEEPSATPFCRICGSEVISKCPNCGNRILGKQDVDELFFVAPYKLPYYCGFCGSPYPWTRDFLDRGIELLSLEQDLDEESVSLLKDSFPDLVIESPAATPLAVARYKKFFPKLAQFIQDGLKNIIVEVASETVKKSLFG